MHLRSLALGALAFTLSCAGPHQKKGPATVTPASTSQEPGVTSPVLAPVVAHYHEARYAMWPRESQDPAHRGKLESVSAQSYAKYWAQLETIAKELQAIDASELDEQDSISYDMLVGSLKRQLTLSKHLQYQIPFNSDSGFFSELVGIHLQLAFNEAADYQNYLSLLNAIPRLVDEHIDNMRAGIKRGFTAPGVALAPALSSISAEMDRAPEASPFYRPFVDLPKSWPPAQQKKFRVAATQAIREGILPAYQKLHDFLKQEYAGAARKSAGVWSLPNGPAYYQALIAHHTDGDRSAIEIHEIGLKEVQRIEAEMKVVREQSGFQGDAKAFLEFLRNDPQFYANTPRELLMEASLIAKRIDAQLLRYFHKLPPRPYGVFPVPDAIAPYYTAGRYAPAGALTDAPGQYWVNTHKLKSRPLYALPALTAHEAVPGHHLQISMHQAMRDLPKFRREAMSTAYIEGWALYSERLAKEMGIYTTPYEEFGRLSYEMWRACRLVVDTGIHAQQWTREHAIEFMREHTALSLHEIETEVDRYISWPGQALSYKMGEIEIRKLRAQAEQTIGADFDIRDFHEVILSAGPLPLSTLAQQVEQWIMATRQTGLRL